MDNGWTIERSVDRASRTKNRPVSFVSRTEFRFFAGCRIIIGLLAADPPPPRRRRSRLVSVRSGTQCTRPHPAINCFSTGLNAKLRSPAPFVSARRTRQMRVMSRGKRNRGRCNEKKKKKASSDRVCYFSLVKPIGHFAQHRKTHSSVFRVINIRHVHEDNVWLN